jgi:peptide chain release factor 2
VRKVESFETLVRTLEDAETLLELGDEAGDASVVAEAVQAFEKLEHAVREVEVQRMLSEEADEDDAVLEINAGQGGTDAADWAEMLKRMYVRWAERAGYKVTILDEQQAEEAGIKSASIAIEGPYAYGYLKSEIGVHRLVRISPFDGNARRHTAFASVHAYPDIDDDIEIDIKESDLRIDVYRSSGAGGQSVNTTDSAVRITHLPTGTVVACQNERSQHKNKSMAMKLLKGKLYQLELEKRQAEQDALNAQKKSITWGSQIRSYVLHPYRMVKDLRTAVEKSDTERVLDGDLEEFMEAFLVARANGTLGDAAADA